LWPLPALARTLCFTVAAHPADGLHIIARSFGIVSLLLGRVEQRIVAAALLVHHASRIIRPVNRAETFAGSAVLPVRFAAPIDSGCGVRDTSTQKRGERDQNSSMPTGRVVSYHVLGLLSAPSLAMALEKQDKIARTWDREIKCWQEMLRIVRSCSRQSRWRPSVAIAPSTIQLRNLKIQDRLARQEELDAPETVLSAETCESAGIRAFATG